VLRELAGNGTPLFPVVKADAYGHGAIPVARALQAAGADGFCVATLDEGVALRQSGIARPILVLYPIPPALAGAAREAGLGVTAGDPGLLAGLLEALDRATRGDRLAVHLEVETGLGRGGFAVAALLDAARLVERAPGARLASLWTHLQAPEDEPRTVIQLRRFDAAADELAAAGISLPPRHVAASAGLLLDGVASLEGARPGLSVYGLLPDELVDAGSTRTASLGARLRPILSLHARPVRVADLPEGWGVGYGPTFTTSRPSRIATLPLGYGDGWPRSLSNRAEALVRGIRVPLVGNVAMDAVMADVTAVPGAPVTTDDEFTLIGEQNGDRITVAELARARQTNSWEVVASLAARLPRVYHAASVPRETRTLIGDEAGGRRSMRP
jgi:alanine racemase